MSRKSWDGFWNDWGRGFCETWAPKENDVAPAACAADTRVKVKQEHLLVAELYRHLATFVDANREIYLSLDGIAARRGVREKLFEDPDVPDLCFTFLDGRKVAIEVKISSKGKIWPGRGQFDAWFGNGKGAHKPTGWVVADEKLQALFYWSHAEIVKQKTKPPGRSEGRYVGVPLPTTTSMFSSVRHLALYIVRVSP